MIFDTEMGADDWMAALMLLRHPAVDLRAITVVGTGLAQVQPGVEHALRLVKLAGREGTVPVAPGLNEPLMGSHAFPEPWRLRADEMERLRPLPASAQAPSKLGAVDTIIACSRSAGRRIALIAGGPLTNIAAALKTDPALADRLEMIYCMGGAVDVPGNAPEDRRKRRVAEWNMYLDPHAAAVVLSSGAPVTLVPLDATNHAPLRKEFFDRLERTRKTEWATFVWKVLAQRFKTGRAKGFFFWDPLTVAIAIDEQRFTTVREVTLEVVEEDGPACGQTRKTTTGGSRVRVCRGANADRFEEFFLQTLNT